MSKIFFLKKIIIDINTSKRSGNTKRNLIWSKKIKINSDFFKHTFETQK